MNKTPCKRKYSDKERTLTPGDLLTIRRPRFLNLSGSLDKPLVSFGVVVDAYDLTVEVYCTDSQKIKTFTLSECDDNDIPLFEGFHFEYHCSAKPSIEKCI